MNAIGYANEARRFFPCAPLDLDLPLKSLSRPVPVVERTRLETIALKLLSFFPFFERTHVSAARAVAPSRRRASAVSFVHQPVSLIDVPIGVLEASKAVCLVVLPLTWSRAEKASHFVNDASVWKTAL